MGELGSRVEVKQDPARALPKLGPTRPGRRPPSPEVAIAAWVCTQDLKDIEDHLLVLSGLSRGQLLLFQVEAVVLFLGRPGKKPSNWRACRAAALNSLVHHCRYWCLPAPGRDALPGARCLDRAAQCERGHLGCSLCCHPIAGEG